MSKLVNAFMSTLIRFCIVGVIIYVMFVIGAAFGFEYAAIYVFVLLFAFIMLWDYATSKEKD